jgi:hypothetical protein
MISQAPTDSLSIKIGIRFLVVTLFPNVAFARLIVGLLLAGAPTHPPSWQTAAASVQNVPVLSVALFLAATFIASVIVHPLNYILVQLAEGYWGRLPFGAVLQRAAAAHTEYRRERLREAERDDPSVSIQLDWLPQPPMPTLPTELGNALYAGEVRAGARYGYETSVVLPRLMPLLDENVRAQVTDTRNQLDVAARIFMLSLLAVPTTTALLIRHHI